MNRKEAKKRVEAAKPQMLENSLKRARISAGNGELLEIFIGGNVHRMIHYEAKGEHKSVYFDIHGGGFAWGIMEDGDILRNMLRNELNIEVFSLEYPLVPEAEFPDALEWLYETILFFYDNALEYKINPQKMIIGGRSAGGNLAAALCLLAVQRGTFQFFAQILDHPYLDLCKIIKDEERYLDEVSLTPQMMEELASAYASDESRKTCLCSPLTASIEDLKKVPFAIILTCELDFLRLDGDRYAEKLRKAGVPVVYRCFSGARHGFTEMDDIIGNEGRQWIVETIKNRMNQMKE